MQCNVSVPSISSHATKMAMSPGLGLSLAEREEVGDAVEEFLNRVVTSEDSRLHGASFSTTILLEPADDDALIPRYSRT